MSQYSFGDHISLADHIQTIFIVFYRHLVRCVTFHTGLQGLATMSVLFFLRLETMSVRTFFSRKDV